MVKFSILALLQTHRPLKKSLIPVLAVFQLMRIQSGPARSVEGGGLNLSPSAKELFLSANPTPQGGGVTYMHDTGLLDLNNMTIPPPDPRGAIPESSRTHVETLRLHLTIEPCKFRASRT
ncbi:MAG: hypothetical protein RBG13Loki_4213 [Promethearchaeota archaeon CR_4]|nr:MAG: hypothetical protein RBG13Loki_4213 [Candidatus Lokiarchaeota archaeon CR_4]